MVLEGIFDLQLACQLSQRQARNFAFFLHFHCFFCIVPLGIRWPSTKSGCKVYLQVELNEIKNYLQGFLFEPKLKIWIANNDAIRTAQRCITNPDGEVLRIKLWTSSSNVLSVISLRIIIKPGLHRSLEARGRWLYSNYVIWEFISFEKILGKVKSDIAQYGLSFMNVDADQVRGMESFPTPLDSRNHTGIQRLSFSDFQQKPLTEF